MAKKNEVPKLVDIFKKLIKTPYDDLEEEEKLALCNYLILHGDYCDDPGFFGDDDAYDDTGFKDVKIKQTSYDDDDAMANTIKFIFDGYAYRFEFLSATNWEEDLSRLYGWDYSVNPVKTTESKFSEGIKILLKKTIEVIEEKEVDVSALYDIIKVLGLTPEQEIVQQFINWAVLNKKGYFFGYDTPEYAIEEFEKSLK